MTTHHTPLRIALLGAGKTGSQVQTLATEFNAHVTIFNRAHPFTLKEVNNKNFDLVISFLYFET